MPLNKKVYLDWSGADIFDALDDVSGGFHFEWFIQMLDGDDWVNGSYERDTIRGGAGDDHLLGWYGNDVIYGDADDDFLGGEQGNDELYGGDGKDTLHGGSGDDTMFGGEGNDELLAVIGGNDQLFGGNGSDKLLGDNLSWDRNFYGEAGQDTILAGSGSDNLDGGEGSDYLNGGIGWDTAWYGNSPKAVEVDLAKGFGSGGWADWDLLSGIEAVVGSHFNDVLRGDAGDNELRGLGGTDVLFGEGGRDTLKGGGATDILVGGDDYDELQGNDGSDQLSGGSGFDSLFGGLGNDTLLGGDDVDYLFGDEQNDRLDGGGWHDDLSGGIGADRFAFKAKEADGDEVLDFEVGSDKLDFGGYGVELTVPEKPLGKPREITLEHDFVGDLPRTLVLIDLDGDKAPDETITVTYMGNSVSSSGFLSAADIIV